MIASDGRARGFALAVWATAAAVLSIIVFTGVAGLVNVMAIAAVTAVAAIAAATVFVVRRVDLPTAVAGAPRWARRYFVLGAALLLVQLVPIAAFIIDPNITAWPAVPWRPWQSAHSCMSAYWVAATVVDGTPNVYADALYSLPQTNQTARRQPLRMGPLNVDVYEYPPTFLPVPRLMAAATTDFWQFRRLWFALNLAGVVICLIAVARRVDTAIGTQALWLTPWVLASPALVGTLQIGNAQLLFIGIAAAAMLLFERGRHAAGGALLAYAVVSKLFPGVLVFYLLLRREWRAVGWTMAWSVAILAVAVVDLGTTPFAAFLDHLPRLLSGEAFPAFRNPDAIAVNESVPGLVFKIGLLGGPALGFGAARVIGWAYTLFLIAVTAWLALRRTPQSHAPLVWIAILVLATMRSPFLPHYAGFPSVWLATLLAAVWWERPSIRCTAIVWFVVLAINLGQGYPSPKAQAIWTFVHTVAAFALVAAALRATAGHAAAADQPALVGVAPA